MILKRFLISLLVSDFRKSVRSVLSIPVAVLELSLTFYAYYSFSTGVLTADYSNLVESAVKITPGVKIVGIISTTQL